MRHTGYKTLFENLVQRHKELKAAKAAFSQMHLSANPYQQQLDLTEFYSSLKNKAGIQVVLQSFVADYNSNNSDNASRWLHGALLILDKVAKDDWDLQGLVYDKTERLCEEILAAAMPAMNDTNQYLMKAENLQTEKIGSVQGFHGTRVNFSIKQLAAPALRFNASLFD